MTPKQAAAKLHGSEYGDEGTDTLFKEMKAAGLVAAFGASDDLLEFRGAIYDEVGAYNGKTVYMDEHGPIVRRCHDEDCPYDAERMAAAKKSAKKIDAVFSPKELHATWLIASNIPHETFDVMEDGELFCRGIVFRLKDAAA